MEIYSIDSNGKDITRITFTGLYHRIMGLDVTGRYLVVTRIVNDTNPPYGIGNEDKKSLWLTDLKEGKEKLLTDIKNNAEGDSFSPDGEWIVFYMSVYGENQSDIYKIRRDGSNLTRLTFTSNISECDPAWSNNGSRIAFISYSLDKPRFILKTMDVDGKNIRTIYDCNDNISTPSFPPGVYDPSWSTDDQWIIFEKPVSYKGENGGAGVWHIFKIRVDRANLIDLSSGRNMAEYLPSFSEDGHNIIFTARYNDSGNIKIDIFKMDENGLSLVKLTDDKGYNEFGIWVKHR